MRIILSSLAFLAILPGLSFGQHWEVGGSGGYNFLRDVDVTAGTVTGKTGFDSGFAAGAVLGNNLHRLIGGEIRYTYQKQDLKVTSGSSQATLDGRAHALHYDVLIHATPRESAIRPFFAIGAGVKYYQGTGTETAFQPLSNLVLLTRTNEAQPLVSVGGGVKVAVGKRALVRFDFRDYATPLPTSLLVTPPNSSASGWIHDFVFLVGLSATF